MAHSDGTGTLDLGGSEGRSRLNASQSGVYPYFRFDANRQISLGGMLGGARGKLEWSGGGTGPRSTVYVSGTLAAIGIRRVLLPAEEFGGFDLAT